MNESSHQSTNRYQQQQYHLTTDVLWYQVNVYCRTYSQKKVIITAITKFVVAKPKKLFSLFSAVCGLDLGGQLFQAFQCVS